MGIVAPLFGVMNAINQSYAAQSQMFGAQNAMLNMANNPFAAGGNMGDTFERSKNLELANEQAKFRFAAYQAWLPSLQQQIKENIKLTFGNAYMDK